MDFADLFTDLSIDKLREKWPDTEFFLEKQL